MLSRRTKFTLVRTVLPAFGHVAPEAAARWATRLWMTVPRARRRWDDSPPGGTAVRVSTGDTEVSVHTWGAGPPVYLLHGWGGWRGQLGSLVYPLVGAGFRVVAIDAPGHGTSGPGRFGPGTSSLVDFVSALSACVQRFGRPAALIGHSMGGSASALAVADGLGADAVVLLNGAADPLGQLDLFIRALRITPSIRRRIIAHLEAMVGRPLSTFDLRLRPQPEAPVLIVHDVDDRQVGYPEADQLAQAWPSAQLVTTAGRGHHGVLRDRTVARRVVGFVRHHAEVTVDGHAALTG